MKYRLITSLFLSFSCILVAGADKSPGLILPNPTEISNDLQDLEQDQLRASMREELRIEMESLMEQKLKNLRAELKKEILAQMRQELSGTVSKSPYATKPGTYAVKILLLDSEQKALSNTKASLKKIDRRKRSITEIATATTNAKGELIFTNLEADQILYLYVGKTRALGLVDTREVELGTIIESELTLPPKPPTLGEEVPNIELVGCRMKQRVDLSDFRGKVIYLSFWASWDAASAQAVQKNQQILESKSEDWKNKVQYVALSIDDNLEVLNEFLEQKSWSKEFFYWSEEQVNKLTAAQIFAVKGVPSNFLIDAEGKLVWKGEAKLSEIEDKVNELLEVE